MDVIEKSKMLLKYDVYTKELHDLEVKNERKNIISGMFKLNLSPEQIISVYPYFTIELIKEVQDEMSGKKA